MFEKMTLEIDNIGPISSSIIDLGKNINIICGVNGSGKTTISKLLYCFLTANTKEKFTIANKNICSQINDLILELKIYLQNKEDISKLDKIKGNLCSNKNITIDTIDKDFNSIKKLIKNSNTNNNTIEKQINNIEISINIVKDNSNELNSLVIKYLINSEFSTCTGVSKLYGTCNGENIEYLIDYENNKFKITGVFDISNVIYINSQFRIDNVFKETVNENTIIHHNKVLFNNLISEDNKNNVFDEVLNKDMIKLSEKIDKLIGGEVKFDYNIGDFVFIKNDEKYLLKNTSECVKQLATLQLLLKNRTLFEDNLLIMDEIDANLHPYWQFKIAELLTEISKELNIMVFINTHSSLFLEALEVYTAQKDLRETTHFFLTEKENKELYNVRRIKRRKLYEIYENLGNPYDEIDKIRVENNIH